MHVRSFLKVTVMLLVKDLFFLIELLLFLLTITNLRKVALVLLVNNTSYKLT